MLDHAGPSGLIVKAVVDHADGSRQTFVSDGTWKISKANEYTNAHDHDPQRRLRRPRRALRRARRATGLEHGRLRRRELAARLRHRRPPAPAEPPARDLQQPRPARSRRSSTRRSNRRRSPRWPTAASSPTSATCMSAMPKIVYASGAGRPPGRRPDELPPQQHDARRGRERRRHEHQGRERQQLRRRRQDHGRPGRQRLRQGRPGDAHDHRRRHTGATGTAHARPPLSRNHANARFVEGSRAGTSTHDTQGSNLGWWWTQKDGPQSAQAFTYWGWRYLQILPPGAGETPQISAVVQHSAAPRNRRATLRLRQRDARRRLRADAALGDLQLRGGLPRHADAREGPVHRRHRRHLLREHDRLRRPQRERPRDPRDRLQRDPLLEGGLQRLLHRRAAAVLVPEHRHPGPRERRLSQRRQHARHPGLHADDARLGVALLRAVRRQGAARAELRDAEVGRQLRQDQHRDHRQRLRPGLQPVRRHQLLPVRDHRLAGADALRLHLRRQRRAHDPQRARGRHPARHGQGRARAGQARGRRGLRRLGGRPDQRPSTPSSPAPTASTPTACPRPPATRRSPTPPSTRRPTRSTTASRPRRTGARWRPTSRPRA